MIATARGLSYSLSKWTSPKHRTTLRPPAWDRYALRFASAISFSALYIVCHNLIMIIASALAHIIIRVVSSFAATAKFISAREADLRFAWGEIAVNSFKNDLFAGWVQRKINSREAH